MVKIRGHEPVHAAADLNACRSRGDRDGRAQGPWVDLRYGTTLEFEVGKQENDHIEYVIFLHIFDHDNLRGWRVVVRAAQQG